MKVRLLNLDTYVTLQEVGDIIETGKNGNKKRIVLRAPVTKDYLYEA